MKRLKGFTDYGLRRLGLKPPGTLFDPVYYCATYEDIAATPGIDPYRHYVDFGVKEGRQPNAYFDTNFYLAQIKARPRDPTLHYLTIGAARGLNPHPHFETQWYLSCNEDVARAGLNPLQHFLLYGLKEGRAPSPVYIQIFGATPGFNHDPSRLIFSKMEFSPQASQSKGRFYDEYALALHVNAEENKACFLAMRDDRKSTLLYLSAPASVEHPTVCIIFCGAFVDELNDGVLTISYSEARLFRIDSQNPAFTGFASAGVFRGVRAR